MNEKEYENSNNNRCILPLCQERYPEGISKIAEQLFKSDDVHIYCMKFWEEDRDLKLNENLTLHKGVQTARSVFAKWKKKVSQEGYFCLN